MYVFTGSHLSIKQVTVTLIHLTSNLDNSIVCSVHPLLTHQVCLQNLLHLLSHLSADILKHRINYFQVTETRYSNQQEGANTTMLLLTSDKTELCDSSLHSCHCKDCCTVLSDHKGLSCACSIFLYFFNIAGVLWKYMFCSRGVPSLRFWSQEIQYDSCCTRTRVVREVNPWPLAPASDTVW